MINLFPKTLQNHVKLLQKSNIMLALSCELSFQMIFHSYRLRIKKELVKNQTKFEQKPNETESGPIEGAQYAFQKNWLYYLNILNFQNF